MPRYDVAIIGGGPGGYAAALRAAMREATVCCIEADKFGGTCLNVGCIPTKAMLHAGEMFWNLQHASQLGITVSQPRLDAPALMRRVAGVVDGLCKGVEFLLNARKVDIVRGRGRLIGEDTISVETAGETLQIEADSIIIATGSRPVVPGFLPSDSAAVMTTDQATTASDLPQSVLIIGGGVIGCEFATIYAELGIETTVIELLDRLVADLDEDISKAITASLTKRNVNVLTGVKVVSAKDCSGGIAVELDDGRTFQAARALAAVGRAPNTGDIGLEELGVEMDGNVIRVDECCRTNLADVYAVGDVAEARQYAHLATRMGIVAADNAAGFDAGDSRRVVPAGMYTHPEVATVGLSQAQAGQSGANVRVSSFPYSASGIARAYGETEGAVKIIADADSGAILGGSIIGLRATETIHEIAAAIRNNLTVEDLGQTIHAHPTFAEAIGEACESWLGLPLHSMG